jgi:hypothetical protein
MHPSKSRDTKQPCASSIISVSSAKSIGCIFSIFPPSFQGNHVKIMDSPATVTAKNPSQKTCQDAEHQKMLCNNVPR